VDRTETSMNRSPRDGVLNTAPACSNVPLYRYVPLFEPLARATVIACASIGQITRDSKACHYDLARRGYTAAGRSAGCEGLDKSVCCGDGPLLLLRLNEPRVVQTVHSAPCPAHPAHPLRQGGSSRGATRTAHIDVRQLITLRDSGDLYRTTRRVSPFVNCG
jgi:hypothetical protein